MSAFTTNQASGAYAPYGMVGVLADFLIELGHGIAKILDGVGGVPLSD
jgi:hypothetical protein